MTSHDDAHDHGQADDAHDDAAHDEDGGGHGADPNAGVVVGEPPTPAWVMTAVFIALVTAVGAVLLAVAIARA